MPNLPRGVPFVDLIAPAGTAELASDLQTKLDLAGGGGMWQVTADDGTMEDGAVPSQPLRGANDRLWIWRRQPQMPGEPFDMAASLAVELAITTQAPLATAGVYGAFAHGAVCFDDARWLLGLLLLDWLYNPRLDVNGELVESPAEPSAPEADDLRAKAEVFRQLWTADVAQQLLSSLPPQAVQVVESHHVLMLIGPDGGYDPRYWQSIAMQLVLPLIRTHAQQGLAAGGSAGPPSPAAPPPAGAGSPAAAPSSAPTSSAASAEPNDGLTPLARAQKQAAERARAVEEEGPVPEPEVEEFVEGAPLRWAGGDRPLLWVPPDRYDAGSLRRWREGSTEGQARGERAPGELLERWVDGGAHFVTEVPFLSRLFVDNAPLHKGKLTELAQRHGEALTLRCHLPRVARVRAVIVGEGPQRRILVCSDLDASVEQVLEAGG